MREKIEMHGKKERKSVVGIVILRSSEQLHFICALYNGERVTTELNRQWPQLSRLRRAGAINISARRDDSVCPVHCSVCAVCCADISAAE